MGFILDDDVCNVEWRLATPGNWNLNEIIETLENFSSLLGKWFRIKFVYKGSLVIQTSASICFLKNDDEFQLSVKMFLRDMVDICNLDVETKTIVKVELFVSIETLSNRKYC